MTQYPANQSYSSDFRQRPGQNREPVKPSGSLLPKTMLWLAVAMGISAVVGYIVGPLIPPTMLTGISVATAVFLLLSVFLRRIPGFSYILLVVIPSLVGVMLYRIIESTVAAGQGSLVVLSLVATVVVFGVTAIIAWFTKKTLYRVMGWLFGITIALVLISILNALLFHLSILSLIISFAVVVVFTLWSFIDVQRIRDGLGHPVDMALNVFLDIVNIFTSILNIARSFSN